MVQRSENGSGQSYFSSSQCHSIKPNDCTLVICLSTCNYGNSQPCGSGWSFLNLFQIFNIIQLSPPFVLAFAWVWIGVYIFQRRSTFRMSLRLKYQYWSRALIWILYLSSEKSCYFGLHDATTNMFAYSGGVIMGCYRWWVYGCFGNRTLFNSLSTKIDWPRRD